MSVSRTGRAHLRLLAAALVAAALVPLAPAAADARVRTSGPATCASSSANPHAVAYTAVRSATLCLLNRERRKRGLRGLRYNRRLAKAAGRHAWDMVRKGYFAHDSQDGRDFVNRIMRTRYVRSRRGGWVLGENLAWGSGSRATPRSIVRAWMRSRGHRRNILNRRFREIGVAFVLRAPVRGQGRAATYVTEFGAR
ncbi:MAG: CAP domain-containing protein [Thermoleophilaceae bacterium]